MNEIQNSTDWTQPQDPNDLAAYVRTMEEMLHELSKDFSHLITPGNQNQSVQKAS